MNSSSCLFQTKQKTGEPKVNFETSFLCNQMNPKRNEDYWIWIFYKPHPLAHPWPKKIIEIGIGFNFLFRPFSSSSWTLIQFGSTQLYLILWLRKLDTLVVFIFHLLPCLAKWFLAGIAHVSSFSFKYKRRQQLFFSPYF